jgi:uncharacterized DUF497 family protein
MIEFDPHKAALNFQKHGVSFAETEPVFYDERALTREDEDAEDESRFVTVGLGALGRILTVCWTLRGESVRVISARLATAKERNAYER